MGKIRSTKSTAKNIIGVGNPLFGKVSDSFLTANLNWWGNGSDGSLDVGANAQNYNVSASVDDYVKVLNLTYLRVRSGYTLSTSNRCRGLAIYVDGDALIEGTITMTARGAYTPSIMSEVGANGLRFIRRKSGQTQVLSASDVTGTGSPLIAAEACQAGINSNGKIYQIPRTGGAGGIGYGSGGCLRPGGTVGLCCGGGGAGSGWTGGDNSLGGSGSAGTCFSGGSGGSGSICYGSGMAGGNYGGAGGSVTSNTYPDNNVTAAGGAGNPGGNGKYPDCAGGALGFYGATGTGGLLLLFVRGTLTVAATGWLTSNGANGGAAWKCGGSSGGGTIVCLYGTGYSNSGTIQTNGGVSATGTYAPLNGGAGGAGYVLVEQVDV